MRTNKICGWQTCAVASSAGAFRTARVTRTLPSPLVLCGAGLPAIAPRKQSTGTDTWGCCRGRTIAETRPNACRNTRLLMNEFDCRRLRNAEAEVHVHFLDWAEASVRSAEYPGSELQDIQPCGSREGGFSADAETARAESGICPGTLLYRTRSEDAPARGPSVRDWAHRSHRVGRGSNFWPYGPGSLGGLG